jgi:hypothetical protein
MTKLLAVFTIFLLLCAAAASERAIAQNGARDSTTSLSRLRNIPRYQGRVLGTHIKRDGGRYLYEVRILRRDDRVILVYIDPETGGVVGDSLSSNVRPSQNRNSNPRRPSNNRRDRR